MRKYPSAKRLARDFKTTNNRPQALVTATESILTELWDMMASEGIDESKKTRFFQIMTTQDLKWREYAKLVNRIDPNNAKPTAFEDYVREQTPETWEAWKVRN